MHHISKFERETSKTYKMKTMKNLLIVAISVLLGIGCSPKTSSGESESENSVTEEATEITLTKAPSSPEFPDASLIKAGLTIEETDSLYALNYSFEVGNYELGAQTVDASTRGIANSGKGQHIHYIVNNGPYAAHYMSDVPDELEAGNYVVLAFLSRSYHESVKSEEAFFIENITLGDVEPDSADLTAPHLFYSRPKGTYKGADTKTVMLDFYLLNETISPDGNKIKATINENEFTIDEWAPYFIEGLPMGENTIKLELVDVNGNLITGPFNAVERSIILEE